MVLFRQATNTEHTHMMGVWNVVTAIPWLYLLLTVATVDERDIHMGHFSSVNISYNLHRWILSSEDISTIAMHQAGEFHMRRQQPSFNLHHLHQLWLFTFVIYGICLGNGIISHPISGGCSPLSYCPLFRPLNPISKPNPERMRWYVKITTRKLNNFSA